MENINNYKSLASEVLQYLRQLSNMEFANFELTQVNESILISFHIQAKPNTPAEAFKNNVDNTFSFCFANESFVKYNLDNISKYTIHKDKDFFFFKSLKNTIPLSRTSTCGKCGKVHYHLSVIYCDNPKKDCPEKLKL